VKGDGIGGITKSVAVGLSVFTACAVYSGGDEVQYYVSLIKHRLQYDNHLFMHMFFYLNTYLHIYATMYVLIHVRASYFLVHIT
jgi:hypothetical protein